MQRNKTGFIGGGNMASALISGLLDGGYPKESIWVSDVDPSQLGRLRSQYGVRVTNSNVELVENVDIVVLAVKPQVTRAVVKGVGARGLRPGAIMISVVAGIRGSDIEKWLGQPIALVRAMPNTPALLRAGATGLYANACVQANQRDLVESIIGSVGLVVWLESELQMDGVTALSGSGPAYFFLLMEAMEDSVHQLGLDQETARALIEQTAFGAARMALEGKESAAELRRKVTSSGGTTQKAIELFEQGGFHTLVAEALLAARDRSIEMSRELGGE